MYYLKSKKDFLKCWIPDWLVMESFQIYFIFYSPFGIPDNFSPLVKGWGSGTNILIDTTVMINSVVSVKYRNPKKLLLCPSVSCPYICPSICLSDLDFLLVRHLYVCPLIFLPLNTSDRIWLLYCVRTYITTIN